MGESKIASQTDVDDINETIDRYKSIVDNFIQKEKSKLRQLYDEEANVIINSAWKKAEEIIAASQKEAQATQEKLVSQARKEAAEIINTAKFEAQKIISEAEKQR